MERPESERSSSYADDFEAVFETTLNRKGWKRERDGDSDSLSFTICLVPPEFVKTELISRALEQGLAVTFTQVDDIRCNVTVVNMK